MYNDIIKGYALYVFNSLKDKFTEEQKEAFFDEMRWVMDCVLTEEEAAEYWRTH